MLQKPQRDLRQSETSFQEVYRAPRAEYLSVALLAAAVVIIIYYALDVVTRVQPSQGGAQTLRLFCCLSDAFAAIFIWQFKAFTQRNYTIVANLTVATNLLSGAFIAYYARIASSYVELYWGMSSAFGTAVLLVYILPRLGLYNTVGLCTLATTFAIFLTAQAGDPRKEQLIRLSVQLIVENILGILIRLAAYKSERRVFELDAIKAKLSLFIEVFSNFSHEFGTPLHSITQVNEAALRSEKDPRKRELFEKAIRAVAAISELTSDLISQAREGDALFATRRVTDITVFCRKLVNLHDITAACKQIELKLRFDILESDKCLVVDENKLREVLSRLIAQAITITPTGMVELEVKYISPYPSSNSNRQLEFVVRSNGKAHVDTRKINRRPAFVHPVKTPGFDIFGEEPDRAALELLIIGLNGNLSFEGGTGSEICFVLVVPVSVTLSTPLDSQRIIAFEPPEQRFNARLLLVDDEPTNPIILSSYLREIGFEVTIARDGSEAVKEYSASTEYDIVLMDINMPVMDGYEATRRIREIEMTTGRRVPIIAVTANTLNEDRLRCLSAGMDGYVGKPFKFSELNQMLAENLPAAGALKEPGGFTND